MLIEPPHDPTKWFPVLPYQDPDWYDKSVVETSWPAVTSAIAHPAKHLQTDFSGGGALAGRKIKFTADLVGTWTYETFTGKRDLDEYAKEWVKKNEATVDGWLAQ